MLTIDFTVAKVRGQAGFADLAPLLPDGFAVWGTDQDPWSAGAGRSANPARCVACSRQPNRFPGARDLRLLRGASLACALARRLGGPHPPAVVLFDPAVIGPLNMLAQLTDSLRQLAGPAGHQDELDTGYQAMTSRTSMSVRWRNY